MDHKNKKRCAGTAVLAGVLAAVLVGNTVSLSSDAARSKRKKTQTSKTTASSQASGQTSAKASQEAESSALVKLLPDAEADTVEQGLFTVLNSDRTRIINYAGEQESDKDVRYMSMAGGQERASVWNLNFQVPAGSLVNGTQTVQVNMTLKNAMNGRTLRTGESLQAFLDNGNGFYYKLPTVISGNLVSVTVPVLIATDHQYLAFVITSGSWSPSAGYDYLAIGNSITMHPRQSYWPDAMGMGATRQEYDYYHIVSNSLAASCAAAGTAYNSAALNYAIWEIMSGQRSSVLYLLDPYLSEELELVTIQLGENAIPDAAGFAQDFPLLIQYIRQKAPNARIVIVGNFWNDAVETAAKLQCVQAYGLSYVDLSGISVDPYVTNTQSSYVFGSELAYDANGVGHSCTKEAVKLHPNNAGMAYIAQSLLQVLGQ